MFQGCTNEIIRVSWCEFYVSQLYNEVISSLCILLLILSFRSHQGPQIDLPPFEFPTKLGVFMCVSVFVLALRSLNRTAGFLTHNFPWNVFGKVFLCLNHSASQQVPKITAALPQATNTRELLGRPPVVPVDWKSNKRAQNPFCFYTWKYI
jgi:hypothetical protein